ncbi:MAG: aminotransferase class III-fold pyridoxal phosphate-dependent enzyme [Thermomicrobiales bacterium]
MVEERLAQGDIAAIIAEPSGGSWGQIPMEADFLRDLREIATRTNTILIFDEVITGFRWSPGGAQGRFGIIPDLTTMAKILAGGFPGGAVAGRADIMEGLVSKMSRAGMPPRRSSTRGPITATLLRQPQATPALGSAPTRKSRSIATT